MQCNKLSIKTFALVLIGAATAIAGEYSFLIKNETSQNSRTSLYFQLQTTTAGRTQNSRCSALSSYGNGSFYLQLTIEADQSPKLTFYTASTCRANTSVGSISPFEETDSISSNIIITIADDEVTLANSPDPITAPTTTSNDGDRPGGPGTTPTPTNRKVIRFFAPWTNTSAIVYVAAGDSAKMTTVKNYCGWFEARIAPPEGSFQVYFKQTFGSTYVGDNVYNKINPSTQSIWLSLDDVAKADTIWVKANKAGAPNVTANYPGILGDCPTKTLPVMMFDWLHGTNGDGDVKTTINRSDSTETISYGNGAKDQDPDLGPIYATSNDFGSGGCGGSNARDSRSNGYMAGMVEEYLGPNGVPVRAANFPEACKITEHLNQWFLPQVITTKNGKDYSNATCRSIEFSLDNDGFWLGQKDNRSPEGGLFLLDDFEYLDEEKTIKNPFFDNLSSGGKRHNYGFTMKIQASFEYIPGQYFEFFGDDDVWVFINNKLAVDLGGQHAQVFGSVDLDTLGLTEGANYPFHIFYAERHTSESNFMMRTSIDLEIPSNITIKDLSTDSRIIKKEVWQKIHENALSCDFSANSANKQERGPSTFTLFGGNLPTTGVQLDKLDTAYYSGITISNNFTTLTINTKSISQALPAGSYYVRTTLKSIPNEHEDVHFSISAYQATSNSSTNAKSSSSNAKISSSSNKPASSNSASGKSSSSKNNSKSSSSSGKAVSSSSKTSNERPDFYVKMTGPFEFEIVMDETAPSLAKKYAVMDMNGQVLSVGELSEKNALVKVPNRGAYIVKLGLSYQRVNIR